MSNAEGGSVNTPDLAGADFERAVSTRLATILADGPLWNVLTSAPRNDSDCEYLTSVAVNLYEETAGWLEADAVEGVPSQAGFAVGVLRDIGDACALTAGQWPVPERDWNEIPSRAVIELEIRLYGISEWVNSRGLDLELTPDSASVPDEAFRSDDPLPEFTLDEFAGQIGVVLEGYDRFRALLNHPPSRAALRSVAFRAAVRTDISSGRGWVVWGRRHLESEVLSAALLPLYVAQGTFVAASVARPRDDVFPSEDLIRDLLSGERIRRIFDDAAVELPAWVQ